MDYGYLNVFNMYLNVFDIAFLEMFPTIDGLFPGGRSLSEDTQPLKNLFFWPVMTADLVSET